VGPFGPSPASSAPPPWLHDYQRGIVGSNRGHFFSALLGALVAVVVMAALPAVAGNGDNLVLGEKNTARRTTKVTTKGGVLLRNTRADTPAASFEVVSGAPIAVNSSSLVSNLNADLLDGRDAATFADSGHHHLVSSIVIGAPALHSVGAVPDAGWVGIGDEWRNPGSYVTNGNSDGSEFMGVRLFTQVDLPQGATITGLSARIYDGATDGSIEIRLLRDHRTESLSDAVDWIGCRTVLKIVSNTAANPGWASPSDPTVGPDDPGTCLDPGNHLGLFSQPFSLVDNSTWFYYLQVELVGTAGHDERFRSAEVTFTPPAG